MSIFGDVFVPRYTLAEEEGIVPTTTLFLPVMLTTNTSMMAAGVRIFGTSDMVAVLLCCLAIQGSRFSGLVQGCSSAITIAGIS